jgi:tetratricopeptide (TPR) repeat protein
MALSQIRGYQTSYFGFVILILGLLLAAAWMLGPPAKAWKAAWRPVGENALAIGLAFAAVWFVAFHEMHAEITGGWGRALVSFGRLDAGTEVLQQAVREMPYSIFYRRELGAAFIRRAQAQHNFEAFDWLARQAEVALIPAAAEVHGMSTAGADLARLYLPWAAFTPDAGRRLWLAQQAKIYFARQQRFAPCHPVSWLDSAVLDEFLDQPKEADRELSRAIGLMDWRLGYWAGAYRKLCLGCSAPELRQAYARVVLHLYETGVGKGGTPGDIAVLRMGRAFLNAGLGRMKEASEECEEVQAALPAGESWQADAVLAEIERQSNHPAEARMHIDKAIEEAPAALQEILVEMKRKINAR